MKKLIFSLAIITLALASLAIFKFALATNHVKTEIVKINDEIKNKRRQITDLNEQIESYQKEIRDKEKQVVSLGNQLSIINTRIKKTELDIRARELDIDTKRLEIKTLDGRIIETDQKIKSSKAALAGILREIYKNDQNNLYLTLLLENSFSEFLEEAQYLENLESALGESIKQIKTLYQQLQDEKIARETEKTNLEEQLAALDNKKDDLEENYLAKQILTNDTKEKARELERLTSELRAQWHTLNSEVTTLEEKLKTKLNENDKFSFRGEVVLSWPIPNYGITTYFNDPGYPFRYIFEHSGIDIRTLSGGRPTSGLTIRAAAPGIVAKVVRNSPYGGNIIYIAHASGIMTVYMHLLRIDVAPDQEVERGEIIGLSGGAPGLPSSGRFTTGPHLHFEVRRNGLPVNPLLYLVSGI